MQPVRPYIDENYQLIFIETDNQRVQDLINGALLGILIFLPIALATPRPV